MNNHQLAIHQLIEIFDNIRPDNELQWQLRLVHQELNKLEATIRNLKRISDLRELIHPCDYCTRTDCKATKCSHGKTCPCTGPRGCCNFIKGCNRCVHNRHWLEE